MTRRTTRAWWRWATFHFHGTSMRRIQRITRITAADGGDHPVVFTSGCSDVGGYGGSYSGGSYPWAGQWWMVNVEDTSQPARYLHPDDIAVQILPEADDVAAGGWPLDVSWLPLLLYFGEWETEDNPGHDDRVRPPR